MGFREDALRAAQDDRDRKRCEEEAQQGARRRETMRKLHKPALRDLKAWSKRTGAIPAGLVVYDPGSAPDSLSFLVPNYGGMWLTWSADGCEFRAWYGPPRDKPGLNVWLQVEMKDPNDPWWYPANTRVQIGEILSGAAKAERERSSRENNWG
jgi:hypothetical protein